MTRTPASSNEAKYKTAKRRIESFSKRFGEPHFYLACHAAFPLALTPDLLYRLWANFQQDVNSNLLNIPWIAVADLLLSNLCNEVGYELYEIDWAIRNELLNQLKNNPCFGQQRILELSDFLLAYMQEQLNSSNPDTRDFAQAQKWTALAYAQPHEAAREIASSLASLNVEDGSEWIRLISLVETLTEPLAGYEPLLVYVSGMKSFIRGNITEAKNLLSQIIDSKDEIHVAGVKLLIPDIAKEYITQRTASQPQSLFEKIAQAKNKLLAGGVIILIGLFVGYQIYESLKLTRQLVEYQVLKQKAGLVWSETNKENIGYREGVVLVKPTGVNLRNFIVETEFYNPYDGAMDNWTYGFAFQENTSDKLNDPQRKSFDVWVASKEKEWLFRGISKSSNGQLSNLNVSEGSSNKLSLVVKDKKAKFFVNDMYIQTFDVSEFTNKGDIFLIAKDGISGKLVQYTSLKVWSLDN
ncbi:MULTISPECIES: hypothetical protein [Nostoc]|uniref:Uncharacterized protein n=1 Tax=Nostoc paludosum FACHB-159 TaxID=2692908 RepID=A0ABR8KF55_9NOSO|nr:MULTISPECIES: hypothetical protein [Nostoc]MBD2681873.1 hypothetical protein [Nostoc sp. FACHB-857]MBD2738201.1 hypothetical protein [Nostoc paludosum FACHB-159]